MTKETHEDVEGWSADLSEIESIEFENPEHVQISEQKFPPAKIQFGDSGTAEKHIFVERADKLTVRITDKKDDLGV